MIDSRILAARRWDDLSPQEQKMLTKDLLSRGKPEPKQKQPKRNGSFDLRGYVRCELSASDKDAFREWEKDQDSQAIFGRLVKACDSGYLLKVGQVGQGAQASLCAASTDREWDGYVLVAHAGDATRAAMLLVYKHEVIMRSDWQEWLAEEGEDALR